MGCFLAPLAEAIVCTAFRKRASRTGCSNASIWQSNLPLLEKMSWGGTLMLIVDHVINGELTWRYPFFTALDAVGGGTQMLKEVLTVGLPMAAVLTLFWAAIVYFGAVRKKA